MAADDFVYMFFHIPKTGGSTLRAHIHQNLGNRRLISYFNGEHARTEAKYFSDPKTVEEWQKCKVVLGHFVHSELPQYVGDREVRFFTVLRDPASKLISQYNWHSNVSRETGREMPPPFGEWLKRPARRNSQARTILRKHLRMNGRKLNKMPDEEVYQRAREALDKFWLVGTLENLETSMAPLFEALDLPDTISKESNLKVAGVHYTKSIEKTPENIALAAANCPMDQRLYDEFKG